MSDFYEEEDDDLLDMEDEFVEPELEAGSEEPVKLVLDARRRLESMLEEKRLRDELDDFIDY